MAARRQFNERAYRDALGNFATGVTVVTACGEGVGPVGVTVNSFNSVSLDPPLVLWSLDRRSGCLPVFDSAGYFAINVLSAGQVALSRRFARRAEPGKFNGVEFTMDRFGTPLLAGCAAHFTCRRSFAHDGGDHLIYVGEVIEYRDHGLPALMFYRGRYAIPEQPLPDAAGRTRLPSTGFVDDYLDYLLSHAAACFQSQFDAVLGRAGVTRDEWRILCTLGDHGAGLTPQSIQAITLQPQPALLRTLGRMTRKAWLRKGRERRGGSETLRLTRTGHATLVPLLAAAKAHEADALSHFSDAEARRLKDMLKALMQSAKPLQVRRHEAGRRPRARSSAHRRGVQERGKHG